MRKSHLVRGLSLLSVAVFVLVYAAAAGTVMGILGFLL